MVELPIEVMCDNKYYSKKESVRKSRKKYHNVAVNEGGLEL
jgi:hypothetical protein